MNPICSKYDQMIRLAHGTIYKRKCTVYKPCPTLTITKSTRLLFPVYQTITPIMYNSDNLLILHTNFIRSHHMGAGNSQH